MNSNRKIAQLNHQGKYEGAEEMHGQALRLRETSVRGKKISIHGGATGAA